MVKGGDSPVVHVVWEVDRRQPVRAHMRPDHSGGAGREAVELEGSSENPAMDDEELDVDTVTGQIVYGQLFLSVKMAAEEKEMTVFPKN